MAQPQNVDIEKNPPDDALAIGHTYLEVEKLLTKVVDEKMAELVAKTKFSPSASTEWSKTLLNKIVESLQQVSGKRKIVVHSTISPLDDNGINVASITYGDLQKDDMFSYKWKGDTVMAIVQVFMTAVINY